MAPAAGPQTQPIATPLGVLLILGKTARVIGRGPKAADDASFAAPHGRAIAVAMTMARDRARARAVAMTRAKALPWQLGMAILILVPRLILIL